MYVYSILAKRCGNNNHYNNNYDYNNIDNKQQTKSLRIATDCRRFYNNSRFINSFHLRKWSLNSFNYMILCV